MQWTVIQATTGSYFACTYQQLKHAAYGAFLFVFPAYQSSRPDVQCEVGLLMAAAQWLATDEDIDISSVDGDLQLIKQIPVKAYKCESQPAASALD
jgi:hypothetical protein